MCRTRIVCTLGPASSTREVIAEMIEAGMSVARLNFSHGSREDHARMAKLVREAAHASGQHVALLQDLQGPKLRIGPLPAPVELAEGHVLRLVAGGGRATDEILPVAYEHLATDVRVGGHVLMDDGRIDLLVEGVGEKEVRCRVVSGGVVSSHKGINLPGQPVSAAALSEKDLDDFRFGLTLGVDYVAVSFVRRAADLEQARAVMREAGVDVPLIAKIERPEALENLAAIIEAADGVMVARGDLGVEMPIEQVPNAQKRITRLANEQRKPVITATQMLESMIESPSPTRAEASDVANAVYDGTDAVMLSGETATGAHPARVVAMMRRICAAAEQGVLEGADVPLARSSALAGPAHAIARSASLTAREIDAKAIIAFTQSGFTALLLSKEQPAQTIIAVTPSDAVARRMALYWGVSAVVVSKPKGLDDMMRLIEEGAIASGLGRRGDSIVVVARAGGTAPGTNLLQIRTVGDR
ncbi:MAG: pyruvate kinase [Planctomycetota bacterium]